MDESSRAPLHFALNHFYSALRHPDYASIAKTPLFLLQAPTGHGSSDLPLLRLFLSSISRALNSFSITFSLELLLEFSLEVSREISLELSLELYLRHSLEFSLFT